MSSATFASPIEDRYFEDYIQGATYECGSIEVEEAEVVAFGKRFDPQPFHAEPEEAKQSAFGGLIASGWHTASLMMRLFVDHYLSRVASLSSPGVDELRWLKPARRRLVSRGHRDGNQSFALKAGSRDSSFVH